MKSPQDKFIEHVAEFVSAQLSEKVKQLESELKICKTESDNWKRLYNSAGKLSHYRDRALNRHIKNSSLAVQIHKEIYDNINKFDHLSYSELINKHYDLEWKN